MKKILPIGILSLVLLSSCEKVIDIDLSKVEKKYVIEAILTDAPGAKVIITQTKDFDQDNTFPGISGATVTITEAGGATTTLSETTAGVYEAPALAGTSGKTYLLNVNIAGKVFTASTTMPQKINMDTVYITDEFFFGGTRKIVNVENNDPPGFGNSYRFIQYVNNKREDQIMIRNDEYSDGRKVVSKLFYFSDDEDKKIKSGDIVRVDFLCISPDMYKYWYSLDRSATGSGSGGQATPANPVSNMRGGALGYFSAHTIQTETIVVP
jgi:hypothetical protein